MANSKTPKYWLFQANPKSLRLKDALRAEALYTYPIKNHKDKIRQGDRVIIWQTGKEAGGYALATVATPVGERPLSPTERKYYEADLEGEELRVGLIIDYNLWNRPVTPDMLKGNPAFKDFYAGSSGLNVKATEKQFAELEQLVQGLDVVEEPETPYSLRQSTDHPLNIVLYGPPGTGKTYHTVNYALSIIENQPLEELEKQDRQELRARYNKYLDEGFIHFVSFHQSFSYEDFIEGIKPQTDKGNVVYEIEDGIFKQMCLEAKRNVVESLISMLPRKEIRMDFNRLYGAFLEYIQSSDFETFTTRNDVRMYLHRVLRNGNLTLRREKSFTRITITKSRLRKVYNQLPPDVEVSQETNQKIQETMEGVNQRAFWAVFDQLKGFEQHYIQQLQQEVQEQTLDDEELGHFDLNDYARQAADQSNRFVLIIDEINRGNIAAIFGDLISIIEADKREGGSEGTLVQLPYSKTFLCVPPNLYIVATMNTADRSLDSMDLALRRRFTFVEMEPQAELVAQKAAQPIIATIDLSKLLAALNARIEILLGADYRIGHAYFMNITNFYDLRNLFERQLIPLFGQYFFDDLSKVGLLLGKAFVQKKGVKADEAFADFEHDFVEELAHTTLYEITDPEEWDAEAFISIYENAKGHE